MVVLRVQTGNVKMVKPGVLVASAFVIGLAWRGHYQAAVMVGLCTATLSLLVTMLVRTPSPRHHPSCSTSTSTARCDFQMNVDTLFWGLDAPHRRCEYARVLDTQPVWGS